MDVLLAIVLVFLMLMSIKYGDRHGQLIKTTKRLKKEGKTPLTGKNLTTLISAQAAEIIVLYTVYKFVLPPFFEPTIVQVALVALGLFYLLSITEYVTAWAVWSLFLRVERKKMRKQIEKEQKEEGTI